MGVVEWAVAISLFWMVTALFLGGAPMRAEGDSPVRDTAGILLSFALYLAVWRALAALFVGFTSFLLGLALGTLISVPLIPVLNVLALRVFGVRIRLGAEEHGSAGAAHASGAEG